MKYLIIGGVAGGATAAARIRRISEDAEIILFEKGEHISYANCGLPYYIGGVIAEREKLLVQTPESFGQRFNIDVRVNSEVTAINPKAKTVTVTGPDGSSYTESYDRLLLSPGASPVRPPLPGINSEGIYTLRNVADTDRIKAKVLSGDVKRAVIVGGGFIGLEMAENLSHAGAEVAVVEMAPQVMAPIDFSMAQIVHSHLQEKGVRLYLETAVSSFSKTEDGIEIHFADGRTLEADIVILSIGVRPNTSLAAEAALEIGPMRGIKVDEFLRTSDENIYAVGDAIEYPHPVTGKPWLNYLAGPANRQARIVADNMVFGDKIKYEGAIGTSIAKIFDMTVAATGLAAKRLKNDGIEYLSATIHPSSHAGYYPDALPMTIKVVFAPKDGKLLGAQIVGYDGVDKRIDMIAEVIKNGGTVSDLTRIEQAYAPPYSSAKDPVAIAGYVAENILSGKMSPIYWRDLQNAKADDFVLIDVRTPMEFATGALPGAINIPLDSMRGQLGEIPTGRPIVVYCGVGLRGYLASNILRQNGFDDVRNLIGGIKTFKSATNPLPQPKPFCNTEKVKSSTPKPATSTIRIDACGLSCPGPIMKLKEAMDRMTPGETLEITATDPGFVRDAEAWCQSTGNNFISSDSTAGKYKIFVGRGNPKENGENCETAVAGRGKTFVLFSDDLDKTLATFVLANGAAATGEKVTIFFTFWGLNAIKKSSKPKVSKDLFGKMFSMMLPSDSKSLKLSKMNMFGAGSKMMRHIMKHKNIASLEQLRDAAIENGVEFIACQMSMDVMGVQREELLDNVTIGGVATYMNRTDHANLNLFI
ncbi:FAD-dependent oxidoreductase [uncultured Duncaniella sp.]|uniref:FAD-dependent oxidoreductase n=2 Tax=uncultured Duncaniella sp. TaxID=2768039 RepID=UPI0025F72311|nr:FAD-dependent oxidoreductase [uncultured Duncaniella sp.]